jgi:hypothetical protein
MLSFSTLDYRLSLPELRTGSRVVRQAERVGRAGSDKGITEGER